MPEAWPVSIQPLQITIHRGSTMLVTHREGWIERPRDGLFDHDTRYLSYYRITFEQFGPTFLTAERVTDDSAVLTYSNPPFRAGPEPVDELSLVLRVTRVLDRGLHECLELTSYAPRPISFRLMINLECSFDSIFEVRGLLPTPPRVVRSHWSDRERILTCSYRDRWFSRDLRYHVLSADSHPVYSPSLLIFRVNLEHHRTWRADTYVELTGAPIGRYAYSVWTGADTREATDRKSVPGRQPIAERLLSSTSDVRRWTERLVTIETPNWVVQRAYDQAVRDLGALRFQSVGDEWYPSAGVPWYNAIFGRDALITAIQCLPIGCPFARAVLTRLAELQGKRVDSWTDEEPGKIPHELRVDQLSLMRKIPFNPFYGTVDASLLYVILLSEAYRFSGDRDLLEDFVDPAEGCLRWASEYGDIDGDGFLEYWMRRPDDYHNQGWKDSGDAIVYPDGQIVPDPIAIVEVQGYYFDALRRAAEMFRVLGLARQADDADARADRLYTAFNDTFWLADEQFYALGLDPDKRPIRSAASNPGHLLWSGIVPAERVGPVATRLFSDDLFCGWGVRTLSAQNGAYDPIAYQRGSIWPHDNAIIALGLKQYDHWEAANRIAEGIFAASGFFARGQLPELWAGLDRATTLWPVIYPNANVPQAWAAGSIPMLLRAILGIEPRPDRRRLILNPTLPEWLDELTVRGLQAFGGSVDLRLRGTRRETSIEVLRTTGSLVVEPKSALVGVSR